MPKQLNADAQAYDKEYDAFLKQLEEFHQQRGTPFKRLPQINGKGIDLYLLYVVVTARGGWQKVNSRNEWEDILEDFRLPTTCVNSATALKHIYIRYLDCFERVNFLGEDGDERTNDGDEDESRSLRLKRSARALNIVPLAYNHQLHNISDSARSNSGMSTDQYKSSSYDRLALSLSSPLPNEHDFAFNMCTLLSNEGKHTLQLPQCPRLLEFMLAHTGVFRDKETQKYFIANYKEAKGKSLVQFWIDSIDDKSVLDLLSPDSLDTSGPVGVLLSSSTSKGLIRSKDKFLPEAHFGISGPRSSNDELEVLSGDERSCTEYADSRNEDQRGRRETLSSSSLKKNKELISSRLEQVLSSEAVDLRLEPEDSEIFHLGRDLGLLDSEGTRISQVLHILRNLSFEEINIPILAQSNTCLRFLVLCVCSRWGGLAVGALDTLGNIAAEVLMRDPAIDSTTSLLLTTICQGVSSQDRALVLRCLEVLNRLAINDPNEEILSSNIEQAVYDQICRFLTIHDIMLLIYTLESLYSLSSMGSSSCNSIVRAKGSVQTLISLLTVEAQSYGPEACIGMKVVETVTGVVSESEAASVSAAGNQTIISTTTTSTTPIIVGGTVQNQNVTPIVNTASTNTSPKVLPKPVDVNKRVVPPEVEEFVTNWVLKNYMACSKNAIEQAIVYRHFAASMQALGRKQGLNPVLLSNCVRKVFGTGVGPSRKPVDDGSEKWHYNGIRRKEGIALHTMTETKNSSAQLIPTPIITATSLPVRSIAPASNAGEVLKAAGATPTASSQGLQGSILKAQLSAPLRNSPSPIKVIQHQGVGGPAPNTPSPSYSGGQMNQQPTPTIPRSDNSSLIKSLLANKVTTPVMSHYSSSTPIYAGGHHQQPNIIHQPFSPPLPKQLPQPNQHYIQTTQSKVENSPLTPPNQILSTPVSRGFVQHSLSRGYNNSPAGVGGSASGMVAGNSVTPVKTPGFVQVSRNILKTETSSTDSSDLSKTLSFNGICNELIKSEEELNSTESKKILSFEGILQNGIKEEEDLSFKEGQNEKRNLLADLLERTVGGDVLNGVVEKDLRITDKGIQVVSHMPFARINGPTNGQMEGTQVGIKRPATPDNQGSVKRLAIEDPRAGPDSRITLYVSQNGNDGEILSQGHQVILNQGQQAQVVSAGQVVTSQTVVTPQGQQMIIQRPTSQGGNVIVQQSPNNTANQIISPRTPHHSQVITYTTPSQQIFTTCSSSPVIASGQTQVISAQGSPMISTASGQMIQQVIAHGQGGQKVIIHGNQLSQVLGGQMILPQGAGQNILVQQGGSLQGQVIMQGVSVPSSSQSPVIVQGTNGHNQVLVQGSGQGQVLLQGGSGQGQLVVSGVTQGQTFLNTGGQTMIFTTGSGQQVMLGGSQGGQHVVMSSGSQGQGQMLMQGNTVGNTVFLAPHQGGQGTQKTLIILPNPKMMVSGNQPQSGPVVLPRQMVQVVTSSAATSPVVSSPIRTIKSSIPKPTPVPEPNNSVFPPSMVSVQVNTGGGVNPSGPTATPVTQSSTGPLSTPHIPAPQVLSSGIARRPKTSSGLYYVCEWRGCNQVFSTPGQVYHHACKVHCPPHIVELTCQWVGCDSMVRKRFSAMTHIHDRHCNEQLLQILALRRQQIAASGKTDIPVPQTPPPHPGYAPNAAFHAIKRHALEVINQRDAVEKEGPVTKSIRLTAALILRNLVIYSNSGKTLLKGYEAELANVAISSMESSRTVGQILYDIHLPDHQTAL